VYAPSKSTTADIRTAARIAHARHGLNLIVIDYLTFIRHTDRRIDRREQIGEICKELKRLAKDLKVPVIVLSQLNRQAEGEVPTLAMLRESGSVEEDADQVIFVHRAERVSTEGQIIVAKNRHGQCGCISVDWHGTGMRYSVAEFRAPQEQSKPVRQWQPRHKQPTVKPEGEPWTG
jgi:replicative DNA helicase